MKTKLHTTLLTASVALATVTGGWAEDIYSSGFSSPNGFVERVDSGGTVSTFASGYEGRGEGIAFGPDGHLYVANSSLNTILKISPEGVVSTFAAGGLLSSPSGLAFDNAGNLFVSNYAWVNQAAILKITPDGTMSSFASVGGGGSGLAFNAGGDLFAASYAFGNIWQISPGGSVAAFASGGGIAAPTALAFDAHGDLFVSNQGYGSTSPTISRITPGGSISTFWSAGSFEGSYLNGLAFSSNGNLFASYGNSILRISPSGVSTTYASGLSAPTGIAVPEPSSYALLLLAGSVALWTFFWRKRERESMPVTVANLIFVLKKKA